MRDSKSAVLYLNLLEWIAHDSATIFTVHKFVIAFCDGKSFVGSLDQNQHWSIGIHRISSFFLQHHDVVVSLIAIQVTFFQRDRKIARQRERFQNLRRSDRFHGKDW